MGNNHVRKPSNEVRVLIKKSFDNEDSGLVNGIAVSEDRLVVCSDYFYNQIKSYKCPIKMFEFMKNQKDRFFSKVFEGEDYDLTFDISEEYQRKLQELVSSDVELGEYVEDQSNDKYGNEKNAERVSIINAVDKKFGKVISLAKKDDVIRAIDDAIDTIQGWMTRYIDGNMYPLEKGEAVYFNLGMAQKDLLQWALDKVGAIAQEYDDYYGKFAFDKFVKHKGYDLVFEKVGYLNDVAAALYEEIAEKRPEQEFIKLDFSSVVLSSDELVEFKKVSSLVSSLEKSGSYKKEDIIKIVNGSGL